MFHLLVFFNIGPYVAQAQLDSRKERNKRKRERLVRAKVLLGEIRWCVTHPSGLHARFQKCMLECPNLK